MVSKGVFKEKDFEGVEIHIGPNPTQKNVDPKLFSDISSKYGKYPDEYKSIMSSIKRGEIAGVHYNEKSKKYEYIKDKKNQKIENEVLAARSMDRAAEGGYKVAKIFREREEESEFIRQAKETLKRKKMEILLSVISKTGEKATYRGNLEELPGGIRTLPPTKRRERKGFEPETAKIEDIKIKGTSDEDLRNLRRGLSESLEKRSEENRKKREREKKNK